MIQRVSTKRNTAFRRGLRNNLILNPYFCNISLEFMKKHLNTNKQFMIGNGMMAFAVIFVVVLFVYMSLRLKSKQEESYEGIYEITLEEGFMKDITEVHLNDSILFKGIVPEEPFTIVVNQFAEQGALLFVDEASNDITIINLSDKGGKYAFKKEGTKAKLIKK